MPSSPASEAAIRKIEPRFVQRVWGSTDLSPWFPEQQAKTGEVWFTSPSSPLLVKFIFTSEDLSVQVHPDDEYARTHHNSCGKTEMWHILSAAPGSRVATGLKRAVSRQQFEASLADGSVQELLDFRTVQPGESYFVRAGVVHAIGAGITLCEIQQNCDITYRLYDYGRPRELHLDRGLEVADLTPYESRRDLPIVSDYFRTDAYDIAGEVPYQNTGREWLVVLRGEARTSDVTLKAGEVWEIDPKQRLVFQARQAASALRVSVGGG